MEAIRGTGHSGYFRLGGNNIQDPDVDNSRFDTEKSIEVNVIADARNLQGDARCALRRTAQRRMGDVIKPQNI